MAGVDIAYAERTMLYTIIFKDAQQAQYLADKFNIDLKKFKEEHSEELMFELLRK